MKVRVLGRPRPCEHAGGKYVEMQEAVFGSEITFEEARAALRWASIYGW